MVPQNLNAISFLDPAPFTGRKDGAQVGREGCSAVCGSKLESKITMTHKRRCRHENDYTEIRSLDFIRLFLLALALTTGGVTPVTPLCPITNSTPTTALACPKVRDAKVPTEGAGADTIEPGQPNNQMIDISDGGGASGATSSILQTRHNGMVILFPSRVQRACRRSNVLWACL